MVKLPGGARIGMKRAYETDSQVTTLGILLTSEDLTELWKVSSS